MQEFTTKRFSELLSGMRSAFQSNQNMIEWATKNFLSDEEVAEARVREVVIRLAYDIQAGSYVKYAEEHQESYQRWVKQVSEAIEPWVPKAPFSILEVGVGEATTLSGVMSHLKKHPRRSIGIDISFARLEVASQFLRSRAQSALLAVASLFRMPFADNSIDIVYTSHSLEPNGGREQEAIVELLRVARRYVVLVEPDFENASDKARARMALHGYVTDLGRAAKIAGAQVVLQGSLDYSLNPMNPSGLWVLEKAEPKQVPSLNDSKDEVPLVCPVSAKPLSDIGGGLVGTEDGLCYPIASEIPLLASEHMVLRSP